MSRQELLVPGDRIVLKDMEKEPRCGLHLVRHTEGVLSSQAVGSVKIAAREDGVTIELHQAGDAPFLRPDATVIGFVVDKRPGAYTVNIGAPLPAILPDVAYEGATKRAPLAMEVGEAVCARVAGATAAPARLGPGAQHLLDCRDHHGKSDAFGPLRGGVVGRAARRVAERCMDPEDSVLAAIGKHVAFNVSGSENGRVWVRAPYPEDASFVLRTLTAARVTAAAAAAAAAHHAAAARE